MSYSEDLGPENVMEATPVSDMTWQEKVLTGNVVVKCETCGVELRPELAIDLVENMGPVECDNCYRKAIQVADGS